MYTCVRKCKMALIYPVLSSGLYTKAIIVHLVLPRFYTATCTRVHVWFFFVQDAQYVHYLCVRINWC